MQNSSDKSKYLLQANDFDNKKNHIKTEVYQQVNTKYLLLNIK